ncbi:DUF190 domain-containing protein [Limnochorda pilosa]|uniref:DUF190 domain-containing protein n=1 Tax=Limnochorda pilosa TaxID=1555112 RepID=UPI0018E08FE7|nr:DUF190 domain-containing protein [Limnochorda pilosa]
MRIYVGESDTWQGEPLYHALVMAVRREGGAGATVYRGIEGFGAHSTVHTARVLRLSEDLPVVVEVVDSAERIERLARILEPMVSEGLMVIVEDVQTITFSRGGPEPTAG